MNHAVSRDDKQTSCLSLKRKPLALAVHLIFVGTLCVFNQPTTASAQGNAAAQQAVMDFHIPAGDLASGLRQVASQAGVILTFKPEQTQGKQTAGLQGRYTVQQALNGVLQGSRLSAERNANGSYALQESSVEPQSVLPAVTVTGAYNAATEGTGSYTAAGPSSTATGLGLSLRETPQSVTVMTRQRMDDFNLNTLTEVLEQTPGLNIDHQGDANNISIRGSAVNMQVDGLRQMIGGWATDAQKLYTSDDMVEIDRIEVLKGSSGLMNGDGKYGGTVNMIRKRATRDFQASVGAGFGSWNNYRANADISSPLNEAGTVRGRVVAAVSDGESFRDNVKHNGQTLFGTVDVDLSPSTVLNVGFTYRQREYYGAGDTSMIQAYSANGQYHGLQPRSFNIGAPWSGYEQRSTTLFANLEHHFSNGWSARLRATTEETNTPGEMGIWWTVVPQAIDVAQTRSFTNKNKAIAFDIKGPIELFGRTHGLMAGIDTSSYDSDKYSASRRLSTLGLDYADGGGAIIRPDLDSLPMNNHSTFSSKRTSAFAAGKFSLADPVKLITGFRLTNYEQFDLTPYAYSNFDLKENGVLTPYAGLVVDVSKNISLYGSYASIFNVQSAKDAVGQTLKPERGVTYEVGAKGEFFNKKLNAGIAYFWMKTENTAENTGQTTSTGEAIYRSVAQATRKGYELELSGELAPGWQAQGSFVMNSSTLTTASTTPKNQFKLATSYKLSGALQNLTVGGATRWQSEMKARALQQPDFWLLDLMARYQVNRNLSIGANINNVFDKSYFSGMRDFGRVQYTWGTPRNFNVNMRYTF